METNNNRTWIIIIAIVLVGLIAFYAGKKSNSTPSTIVSATSTQDSEQNTNTTATTSVAKPTTPATPTAPAAVTLPSVNTSGFHSYSDSQNHFTIKYPAYVTAKNTFTTFHEIGNNWRANASAGNQGKPVIALSIYSIDQGGYSTGKQTYPLFFMSEVRVGVSSNTKECYTTDAGYTNQKIATVTINGTTWKKFSSSDAAMMKYVQSESYRTIHNGMCFAVEQIKNGSSYRDEKMTTGKTDAELTAYYNIGNTIIRTFAFTK